MIVSISEWLLYNWVQRHPADMPSKDHTVYPRSEMFSRSSRYSEAQPEQAEAKRRSA